MVRVRAMDRASRRIGDRNLVSPLWCIARHNGLPSHVGHLRLLVVVHVVLLLTNVLGLVRSRDVIWATFAAVWDSRIWRTLLGLILVRNGHCSRCIGDHVVLGHLTTRARLVGTRRLGCSALRGHTGGNLSGKNAVRR